MSGHKVIPGQELQQKAGVTPDQVPTVIQNRGLLVAVQDQPQVTQKLKQVQHITGRTERVLLITEAQAVEVHQEVTVHLRHRNRAAIGAVLRREAVEVVTEVAEAVPEVVAPLIPVVVEVAPEVLQVALQEVLHPVVVEEDDNLSK